MTVMKDGDHIVTSAQIKRNDHIQYLTESSMHRCYNTSCSDKFPKVSKYSFLIKKGL